MNFRSRIFLLTLALIMLMGLVCQAKLELGGNIFAEFISDPKNFDPSIPRSDPWRSGDQGGIVLPGYYVGQFTKINLNLKLTDNQVEAFLPLTLSIDPFTLGSGSIRWQAALITEDYLNIPYYFSMKVPFFTFSASSRPLSDQRFGFRDFRDGLGIFRRPNSFQPVLTFKIDANLSKNYLGQGYVLFDQAVSGVPIWEKIPQRVALENLGGKTIEEYGFVDEVAQYMMAKLEKKTKHGKIALYVGRKNVENPAFRARNEDGSLTEGVTFTSWGSEKSNYGIDLEMTPGNNLKIQSALVGSNVKWYKYDSSRQNEDLGNFLKRWYPSELKGELSSLAGNVTADLRLGSNLLSLETFIVDPNFQAVAAVYDQFSPLERLIPQSPTDPILERKTQMLYDPTGSLFGKKIKSSPIIDYLGKRKLGLTFTKEGEIGTQPVVLAVELNEITSLDSVNELDKDQKTGAYLLGDKRAINVRLGYNRIESNWLLEGKNINYFGSKDYYRALHIGAEKVWRGSIKLTNDIERVWRLKRAGFQNTEGAATKLTTAFSGDLGWTEFLLGLSLRQGNYDYDLLEPISDQVVNPYSYRGIIAYLGKDYEFKIKNRVAQLTIAGEMFNRNTNLENVLIGTSLVGYFDVSYPLGSKWNYETINVFVKGPVNAPFPPERLKNVSHNELVFHYSEDAMVRLGYTIVDRQHQNGFVALKLALGQGNLGISLGRGAAPIYKEGIGLPGTLPRQDFYHQNYLPSQALVNRPWENWDKNNFYASWQNQLRSTEEAWGGYLMVSFSYGF